MSQAAVVAENHPVICEASFSYEGNCAVDILRRENGGYAIYEVKSATHEAEIYGIDIAYQKYVLEHCKLDTYAMVKVWEALQNAVK